MASVPVNYARSRSEGSLTLKTGTVDADEHKRLLTLLLASAIMRRVSTVCRYQANRGSWSTDHHFHQ